MNTRGSIPTIFRRLTDELKLTHEIHGTIGGEDSVDYDFSGIDLTQVTGSKPEKLRSYLGKYLDNFDLVHTGPANHSVLSIAGRTLNRSYSIVHTIHAVDALIAENSDHQRSIRRQLLDKYGDQTVAVSEFVAEVVRDQYGIDAAVIPNGVDLDIFSPNNRDTAEDTYLFVGRFDENKNPELVRELAAAMPNATFKMGGLGERNIKSTDNLEILPPMPPTSLANHYSEATAALCPFENEGFGMVALESMASGTPVVGLSDGNLPNLIDSGKNGVLCDELSISEWIDAIETVSNSGYEMEQLSRESAQQYSWENIASEYEQIYAAASGN